MITLERQRIPDEFSPDRSTCRFCGQPIGFDDWCYVHLNGWADCGTIMQGGTPVTGADLVKLLGGDEANASPEVANMQFVLDPDVIADPARKTTAEPVEWARFKMLDWMSAVLYCHA